jgi:hypothetical protein
MTAGRPQGTSGRSPRRGPGRAISVAARAGLTALLVLAALAATALTVAAADPTSSPGAGGDVRTNPAAPGLVGDPLFALAGVAIVGLVAVAATLLAVRLANRR